MSILGVALTLLLDLRPCADRLACPAEPIGQREADRARIQRHLAAVEAELRARDVAHLPEELRSARLLNLDRLRAYRLAGEFPGNDDFPGERVPFFIDDAGVVCAVGHLVVASGHADVARQIQQTENNARLLDMVHPALPGWIAASGLTEEECARIQPNYCGCENEYSPVCGVDGHSYANACYAETCAGVAIAHEGVCAGQATTGWPSAGETGGQESTGTGASTGADTSSGGSTGADTSSGGATTSEPDASSDTGSAPAGEENCSGCRSAGPATGTLAPLLLLLGCMRRRSRS